MAVKQYDPKRLIEVDIDKVFPNSWNPKEENTKEFLDVKKSIQLKGLRGAIVVRDFPNTKGSYEILDGQQRYTAAKELGYKKLYVYSEGEVDEKEARELTIWYQTQVPFNRITEAYLVTQMVDEFDYENLELPYTAAEIEEFKNLAEFNFDVYNSDDDKIKENPDGTVSFSIKLTREQHAVITDRLKQYSKDYECTEAQALVEIIEGAPLKLESEDEEEPQN